MNLRITYAKFAAFTMGELIRVIDEVSNLYELTNTSYEYEIFHRGESYYARFKLYG